MYIDKNSGLHHPYESQFALTCPHCLTYSHLSPVSIPHFARLQQYKPKQAGIVYRCDACNAVVFLKFDVKSYGEERIEFSSKFHEMERPRESFNFAHLPERVEVLFREALDCYAHNCLNAFSSMCRRTAQRVFEDLGETGKLRVFDQFQELREMTDLDNDTFSTVQSVVFDTGELPVLDSAEAGLLLELMKDMLYQSYIRRGKLQQALMMRRYFLEDVGSNITTLQKKKG